jgi:transcriptional regulator with XRE-family HTH domain
MLKMRIHELAEEKGYNKNQLQLKSGVTFPLLNRYWNNNTESVTLRALDKIARALEVKTVALFIETEEDEVP